MKIMIKRTLVLAAVVASAAIHSATADPVAKVEPHRRIAVGVYFNEETHYCPNDEQAFDDLQEQTGRLAKVYMNFQSWTEQWNQFYWVWSPNIFYLNANNTLAQQQADYKALYPGDGYVDWIGLDGYCDGVKGKWKTFPELFDTSYQAITAISSKPLMIAEFGCSEAGAPLGTSKAAWIKQTYLEDIPHRYPRIELVNWFSRDKTRYGETDWRLNSSKAAQAAYSAAVNSPFYQGEVKLKH